MVEPAAIKIVDKHPRLQLVCAYLLDHGFSTDELR
jgi:hypothetical protein